MRKRQNIYERCPCKSWLYGTLAVCGSFVVPMRADTLGSNQMATIFPAPALSLGDDSRENEWERRFKQELLKNQNSLFDRLGPPADYDLISDKASRGYGIHAEMASRAETAFQRVIQDSARDTALAILPVTQWMEIIPQGGFRTFAEQLFEGSIGNTTERELGGLPATYSAAESWWRNAGQDRTFRYGVRPETRPYLYASSQLGHWDSRPLLTLESRARYLPFHRLQTSLTATVPLPFAFELSLSALCEPTQFSHTAAEAVRLERVIGKGASARAVFLGVSRGEVKSQVLFGFTSPW